MFAHQCSVAETRIGVGVKMAASGEVQNTLNVPISTLLLSRIIPFHVNVSALEFQRRMIYHQHKSAT